MSICYYELADNRYLGMSVFEISSFPGSISTNTNLQENCEKYILCLYDRKNNKYYYIKFPNKSNWLSGSFNSCGKEELFLGKQVLNNQSTIGNILVDLKKKSI